MRRSSRNTVDADFCPSTSLPEPRAMAAALLRHAERSGYTKPLYVLPDPGGPGDIETDRMRTWWIAPERQQPVYRCGKVVVTSKYGGTAARSVSRATLLIGLAMQKGLDPQVAEALPAARREPAWFMTSEPRWVWEDFLLEMAAGHIDPLAANAEEVGGCPLTVVLEARDPSGTGGGEILAFRWSRGEMGPLSTLYRRGRSARTRAFSSASTLAALAQRLRYSPHVPGLWIDLAIGFQLRVDRAGPGAELWDESRVWASACRPWSLWLR